MGSRTNLHRVLVNTPGIKKVYYQPPESIKLEYPCIIYKLGRTNNDNANDKTYIKRKVYDVTLITTVPDCEAIDYLDDLPYASLSRFFVAQNLNHYNYTIFY